MEYELVIITTAYPSVTGAESVFLEPELEELKPRFATITLVPGMAGGQDWRAPGGIEVEDGLACSRGLPRRVLALMQAAVSAGTRREGRHGAAAARRNPLLYWRRLAFMAAALRTRTWLETYIQRRRVEPGRALFYTYWLSSFTLGVGLAKQRLPGLRLVTRAHGMEIYPEQVPGGYHPFRDRILQLVDGLFPVSQDGLNTLVRCHPHVESRARVHRLGLRNHGRMARRSEDGVVRVASCSSLLPVKQVPRIAATIAEAAAAQPARRVEWRHFGDGPEMKAVQRALKGTPPNLTVVLAGQQENAAVLQHYAEAPVDVFMNLSVSEGAPVSIMEALSFGIPVVAPAVGGIPELVDATTGVLLAAIPSVNAAAAAIRAVADRPEPAQSALRAAARHRFLATCDAAANYPPFAADLLSVLTTGRLTEATQACAV